MACGASFAGGASVALDAAESGIAGEERGIFKAVLYQ